MLYYLLTNDIRLHDNQCWDYFVANAGKSGTVIVVLDKLLADKKVNRRFNERAFAIFITAVSQLFEVISGMGYKTLKVTDYSHLRGHDVVMSEDTSPFARKRLENIRSIAKSVVTFDTKHLLPAPKKKYLVYSAYYKYVRPLVTEEIQKKGEVYTEWKPIRKTTKGEPATIKLYSDALKSLHSFDPDKYSRCAKASVVARSGSTDTSWAIARGILSAREVYEYVRKKWSEEYPNTFESFFRELIFRDFYSRSTLWHINNYSDTFRNEGIKWKVNTMKEYHRAIFDRGTPSVIKTIYNSLVKTGKVSNYGRMVFATWTYDIGANWRLGEELFAKYLLDYDFSSNRWNWAHHSYQGLNYQWPNKKFKVSAVIDI